jgi:hypothetical protein
MGNEKHLILWPCESSEQDNKNPFLHTQPPPKKKKNQLTKLSFKEGNISSTLFTIILGTLLP